MPAIGLGTGSYSDDPTVGYGGYPECWSTLAGCGAYAEKATAAWLAAGGRRIDAANSYGSQISVGAGMAASGVPRADIFLLSKVGPSKPLGFNDTLSQFANILSDMKVDYVDMLLVHWPWDSKSQGNVTNNVTQSSDVLCNHTSPAYSEAGCRISTWKAMVQIWQSGGARAIGVSNYNVTHLQEIADAGLPLPALTQSPFHLYRSATQMDVLNWCNRNGVTFLGYSPFGVPDYYKYPAPLVANQLQHPTVLAIAAQHADATPAQVLIAWQWALGIPVNPRSQNAQHMADNLAAYALTLNQTEVDLLSSITQDLCSFECVRGVGRVPRRLAACRLAVRRSFLLLLLLFLLPTPASPALPWQRQVVRVRRLRLQESRPGPGPLCATAVLWPLARSCCCGDGIRVTWCLAFGG